MHLRLLVERREWSLCRQIQEQCLVEQQQKPVERRTKIVRHLRETKVSMLLEVVWGESISVVLRTYRQSGYDQGHWARSNGRILLFKLRVPYLMFSKSSESRFPICQTQTELPVIRIPADVIVMVSTQESPEAACYLDQFRSTVGQMGWVRETMRLHECMPRWVSDAIADKKLKDVPKMSFMMLPHPYS
ncbi:hypothetical protein BDR26DRAFT_492562 [Obelidium mucronatum]|nr:hypothetical protein BDR26DRAFT_492562 [Obelidium mucronatum]